MTTKYSTHASIFMGSTTGTLDGDHAGKNGVYTGTIALETTDLDANDIIGLIPVKSSDSVKSIVLYNDDLDANGTPAIAFKLGLYAITEVAGVKTLTATGGDIDVYATAATTFQAANTSGVEFIFNTKNITTINNEAWQDVAASTDPHGHYMLAITIGTVAATQAAGDISYKVVIA